ncbi:MAG: hypothetical protein R3Y56_08610 [Akkermansia sp.]
MNLHEPCIRVEQVLQHLPAEGLFRAAGLPWLISPTPLRLSPALRLKMERLGRVLAAFQDASHALYRRSASGKEFPWLAKALDAGKPDWLVACQRSKAMGQAAPRVIRPDLLLQQDTFALSELDSVPGGMGITHFLNSLYAAAGFDELIGGAAGMLKGFQCAYPEGRAIAISEESSDYEPEMRYFAHELGAGYRCVKAEELDGQEEQEPLYRFFELFDTEQIPAARPLLERCANGGLALDPPPIPHLEEKAWLALFHQPALQSWWRQNLRGTHREILQELIPHSWLLDATPLPPHAVLPWLNLNSWQDVGQLSQKERRLVLKISGFNEQAWGARGVYIGHDMPAAEWRQRIQEALDAQDQQCWVMQDFKEGLIIQHPYYDRETGEIKSMRGRVRLCPYYFRSPDGKQCQLGGCLATIVPADKKKIHGMRDAILVPCM